MKKVISFQTKSNSKYLCIENSGFNPLLGFLIFFFSICCFVFPVLVIYFTAAIPGFGFVITIIIFGGTGIYSLRLFLWNKFGKEVFEVTESGYLRHYYDYFLFKDNIKIKNYNCIDFGYSLISEYEFLNFQENWKIPNSSNFVLAFRLKRRIVFSETPASSVELISFKIFGEEFNHFLRNPSRESLSD